MHVRSRRSAGPHAIRNRVVALQLAFVQNNHICNQRYPPDFLQTGVSTQVYVRYAQVPQHFAISLIFRTTVDKKENSVEVLPIGPCIYLSHILVLSQYVWIRSIGQLCLPQLYVVQRQVHTQQSTQFQVVGLGCRTGLENVIYKRLSRFSSFDTRHAYLGRQVRISLL